MAGAGRLQVRILGCGSSGGVPRIGNDWGACDPGEPRNRRSRCSILIRHWGPGAAEPTLVLVDTSPDMRDQLLAARVDRLDAVLLTHEHADQCHGIDDLRALVIRHRRRMPVHMNRSTADVVLKRFDYCFEGAKGYPAILEGRVDLEAGQAVRIGGPGGEVEILAAGPGPWRHPVASASGSEPLPIATMSSGCPRRRWSGWAGWTRW